MTAWTPDELARFGAAEEIQVASRRADGTLRRYVTIWVVRVGDELYVRSAYGPTNPWFVRALASGAGRIRTGGLERDVGFERPAEDVHADVDAAYLAKYSRHGRALVGTVTGPDVAATTIRPGRRRDHDPARAPARLIRRCGGRFRHAGGAGRPICSSASP